MKITLIMLGVATGIALCVCVAKGNRLNLLNVKTGQMMLDSNGLTDIRDYNGFIIAFYKNINRCVVKLLDSTTGENVLPIDVKSVDVRRDHTVKEGRKEGRFSGMTYFSVTTMDNKCNIALLSDNKFYGWLLKEGQYGDITSIQPAGPYLELTKHGRYGVMLNPKSLEPVLNGMECAGYGWNSVTLYNASTFVHILLDAKGNKHYMYNQDYSEEIDIGNGPVQSDNHEELAFEDVNREKSVLMEKIVDRLINSR